MASRVEEDLGYDPGLLQKAEMSDSGRRVLIVEDEGFVRDLLVETFTDAGFDVLSVSANGQHGQRRTK